MTDNKITNAAFWDSFATTHESLASGFTAEFAQRAVEEARLPADAYVLDVACGMGALAIAAARAGARVLATDFSRGMVERVRSYAIENVEALQLDGQDLALDDASFDAAFSMFGVMLFQNWRAGLSEMARVVRPGGMVCVGSWKHPAGAAANLLIAELAALHYPKHDSGGGPAGMAEFREPARFRAALESVGLRNIRIVEDTHNFMLQAAMLDTPDTLFQFSPLWKQLDPIGRKTIVDATHERLQGCGAEGLAIPSTALIAIGDR